MAGVLPAIPPSGTYSAAQTVTISDTTPGATIYYAIGAAPTLASAVYAGPITVSSPQTIEAMAVADGDQSSTIASSAYNIQPNQTPSEWTWMGGSNALASSCYGSSGTSTTCHRLGWYGTLGVPAAGNMPGGREWGIPGTGIKHMLPQSDQSGWQPYSTGT